jgi:hypothetical protein
VKSRSNNGMQRTRIEQVFYPTSPVRAADAERYAAFSVHRYKLIKMLGQK